MDNINNSKSILGTDMTPDYQPSSDDRLWAILAHILNIPFPLIAALIIYLVKKGDSPFITDHAKESLNFQITVTIIGLICLILTLILVGILLLWLLGIAATVLIIVATVRAADNKLYRYPFNFRFIK